MQTIRYFICDKVTGKEVWVSEHDHLFTYGPEEDSSSIRLERASPEELAKVLAIADKLPQHLATATYPSRGGLKGDFVVCEEKVIVEHRQLQIALPIVGKSILSFSKDSRLPETVKSLLARTMTPECSVQLVSFNQEVHLDQPNDVFFQLVTPGTATLSPGSHEMKAILVLAVPEYLQYLVSQPHCYLVCCVPTTPAVVMAPTLHKQPPVSLGTAGF